jgi:hypothetical protein
MKKVLIVAAAAGLMTLAACTPSATNNTVAANVEEANAADYDNLAGETVVDANATVDANASDATGDMNMAGNAM